MNFTQFLLGAALGSLLLFAGCENAPDSTGPTIGSSSRAPSTGPSTTGTNGPGPGSNVGSGPIGGSGSTGPR